MTKAEIIDAVYDKVGGFSKKEAAEIVEAVFDTMKEFLAEGGDTDSTMGPKIKISGFGNFVVRAKKQRVGRNPQTGAPIPISARKVLTFKPSQVLKGILNPHKSKADDGADEDEDEAVASRPVSNGGSATDGGARPGHNAGISPAVPSSVSTPSSSGGADESSTHNG